MKLDTVTVLAAALFQASCITAEAIHTADNNVVQPSTLPEPAYFMEAAPAIERRQGVGGGNAAATTVQTQQGTITTQWLPMNTIIGGVSTNTYMQIIYTQTFANVPDQLPSAGSGAIGYGTLTKNNKKRWLETKPTAAPEPVMKRSLGIAGRVRV